MATRIEANKAMKQEMKSFEMCVKMIVTMKNLPDVKAYLNERVSSTFLTEKTKDGSLACKAELFKFCKLHSFKSSTGVEYKAIFRKDKGGNIVEAKWSIWRVLLAIDARYKAMQEAEKKSVAIAEMKAKEESRTKLDSAEKSAKAKAVKAKSAANKSRKKSA